MEQNVTEGFSLTQINITSEFSQSQENLKTEKMGFTDTFPVHAILIISLLHLFFITPAKAASPPQAIFQNVSYGSDPEQIMDIYLPEGRNTIVTKVIVLIHGGGWQSGKKEDFNFAVPFFYATFKQHAIVNMDYRLGTIDSPAFPKQIEDIKLALEFLTNKSAEYDFQPSYALVGNSAGGHLSLLYAYGFDPLRQVQLICNTVGPVDLADPSYSAVPAYKYAFFPLVGNYTYEQNPGVYRQVSPVYYVTKDSPKTISFYGNADPLIPKEQGGILEDKLDSVGVYNKYYLYNGGHGNWNPADSQHYVRKIIYFMKNYF